LQVVTATQEGSGISTDTETRRAGSGAGEADDSEVVGTAKIRSIRRLRFVHVSQEGDSFYITATHVEEGAGSTIVDGLDLVALTVEFDLDQRVGLRQDKSLGWVKGVLEIPHDLRGGTEP
jgi:hypothetical protein